MTKIPIQAMIADLDATHSSHEDQEDDQNDDFDDDIDNQHLQDMAAVLQILVSYYHVILDYKGLFESAS